MIESVSSHTFIIKGSCHLMDPLL